LSNLLLLLYRSLAYISLRIPWACIAFDNSVRLFTLAPTPPVNNAGKNLRLRYLHKWTFLRRGVRERTLYEIIN
jgi:hypothetical protein